MAAHINSSSIHVLDKYESVMFRQLHVKLLRCRRKSQKLYLMAQ